MNLVEEIMDRCSGDVLGKLSSQLNTDEETAGYATSAAVPSLLAGLASVGSGADGARKITSALHGLGSSSIDEVTGMLGDDADAVAQRGSSLMDSLFGDNMIGGIAAAVGKYSGLSGESIRKLLALLAPMVLGKVASAWKTRGGTPQALTSLLAEQRHNIAEAAPAGFSLANVPGWSTVTSATAAAPATARRAAATAETGARSAASWAVPLAIGALGLLLIWSFMRPRPDANAVADRNDSTTARETTSLKPVVPDASTAADVARINDDLRSVYATAGSVLGDITDAASAEAARPELEALSTKIDGIETMLARLPASRVDSLRTMADKSMVTLREQATRTLETPGLTVDIKSLINQILRKLTELFAPAAR
jgi:hypothetical protein